VYELIGAVRRLGRPYHLLLVGPDMPGYSGPRITVNSSYLSHGQVSRLMASADAFVHAGDLEAFGLVVLEAMSCGVPVVGVDAGGVAELVRPGSGVLSRSPRASHLAEAAETLVAMDIRSLGARARRSVESHWSWDAAFRRLLEIYTRLVQSPIEALCAHGPG
jgi:alpha-1,6-mannosyltransferase